MVPLDWSDPTRMNHYQAHVTVRLDQPLGERDESGPPGSTGYFILIGINAPDLATAARHAQETALRPIQPDGRVRVFVGSVVEAELRRVDRDEWAPFADGESEVDFLQGEGPKYSTRLVFLTSEA